MKKCNFKDMDLIAYCYGELSQKKLQEIKEHLSVCKNCFSKVQGFKKTFELVKEQKLKNIPEAILNNYTDQVYSKIDKQERGTFYNSLKQKGLDLVDNFRYIFSPKLIPVFVTACIAIFAFLFIQQSKFSLVNPIDQELALLEEIGEDIELIFLENDEEAIYQAIEDSDEIILAQAVDQVESQGIIDDLELLKELGEEIDTNNLIEDFDILDELDIESI